MQRRFTCSSNQTRIVLRIEGLVCEALGNLSQVALKVHLEVSEITMASSDQSCVRERDSSVCLSLSISIQANHSHQANCNYQEGDFSFCELNVVLAKLGIARITSLC